MKLTRRWILVLVLFTTMGVFVLPSGHTARAASVLTVTTTADTVSPCRASAFSLRCAITQANSDNTGDTIKFNIPSTDRGCKATTIQGHAVKVCTILPISTFDTDGLPVLTANNTLIDGYSQVGATPNTNSPAAGNNAILTIVLDGTNAGLNADGVQVIGTGDTIRGLSVVNFQQSGLDFEASGGTITGNFIGLEPDGVTAASNQTLGVLIRLGPATVGGIVPAADNVISSNLQSEIFAGNSSVVEGNLLGTNAAGTATINPNGSLSGVDVVGDNVTVGGTMSAARNVISGNFEGITLFNISAATLEGNLIGTNVSGTAALGNSFGIEMDNANNSIIGGTVSGARNVISGSTLQGIALTASSANVIEGNYIGTNSAGSTALGNGGGGITLSNDEVTSSNNIIGGTTTAAANVISGNSTDGVAFLPNQRIAAATGNIVEGNLIGTNAAGTGSLGNTGNGVSFGNGYVGNQVKHNVIAHNAHSGILVGASSSDTNVHNPFSQNSMFANGGLGIDLAPQGVVNCTTSPPGPNDYTHCPVISKASTTLISGTAPASSIVEVFIASNDAGALGHGEGQTFLGSTTASTSGQWSLSIANGRVTHGQPVTATTTTTGSSSETSEFAANITVQ